MTTPGSETTAASAVAASTRSTVGTAAITVLGVVAVLVVGIDLATKQLVLSTIADGHVVRVLGGLVYFDLIRNRGAAFSLGTEVTAIFPIIALVVIVGILYVARRLRSVPWAVSLGLIMGGAAGNLIDRLFRAPGVMRGDVVDFISLFWPEGQHFAIFNTADSALCVGVALAILLEFTGRRRDGTRAESTKRST